MPTYSLLKALLLRYKNTDEGTEGVLSSQGHFFLSLELPWRDNEPSYSCIPEGSYPCKWWYSPSKGWCYRVMGVPNRDYILIHSANYAGDRKKGYKSHLRGCIALGRKRGSYKGQRGLFVSKPAMNEFNTLMGTKPFILEIRNAVNPSVLTVK